MQPDSDDESASASLPRPLLLDACVTINVVASGVALVDLGRAMGVRLFMTSVAAREVLYVEPVPGGDREVIDVLALATTGVLEVVELDAGEVVRYVELAREVDDGEAATIAVAACRGWDLATDDRKGRRTAEAAGVATVGTAAIMRSWQQAAHLDDGQVVAALRMIERRASFSPRRDDPEYSWWEGLCRGLGQGPRGAFEKGDGL